MAAWDVHHWQDLNPVVPEGLVQMSMGTPAAIYHGGLLHASVRYFDPQGRRPGLPPQVAALVEQISDQGIRLQLVNLDPLAPRDVLLQAGAYGEHRFTEAGYTGQGEACAPVTIGDRHLRVRLGPAAQVRLDLGMARLTNQPTYAFPPFD